MSRGYTGLVLQYRAELGFFNYVNIYALETFETEYKITCSWHRVSREKYTSRYKALRRIVKVNRL